MVTIPFTKKITGSVILHWGWFNYSCNPIIIHQHPTIIIYPLVMTNIAMDSPFIDGLPIKNGDFPWLY